MTTNTTRPTSSDPVRDRILSVAAVILTVTSAALAVALAVDPSTPPIQVILHVLLALAGVATMVLLRMHRRRAAAGVLIGSYWSVVTVIAALNGGLRGPNLVNYPLILVITGWLAGSRPTLVMAAMTQVVFIAFLVADYYGVIPPANFENRPAYFIFLTAITLMTAAATWLSRRGYLARVAEARRTAETLRESQEELERHRDHLAAEVRARTRELEEARDAAQAANLAKSHFLANMSHEIRTPLNAITGMAHLIRRSGLDATQSARLEKMEVAGNHLLEVVNAILDLSKIEAGKFELEEAPMALGPAVEGTIALLHAQAADKGLALRAELGPMPPALLGDATRIRQMLVNLIGNAIKFTQAGSVLVRANVVGEDGDRACVRIEVIDTGVGIAPEAMSRLFSSFEQADNTTTRKYGGTGLGLAITRRLATMMGGDAGAESTPGAGSRFWFTARLRRIESLPAPEKAPTGAAESAEARLAREQGGARVLVVDDEPVNREITTLMLEQVGLRVDVAENGAQAVDCARHSDYGAILMDMQMPVMDGLQATRIIRDVPGRASTPIIAMTANAFGEDRQRCLEAGMNGFVSKPVSPETLYSELARRMREPVGQA